MVAVTSVKRAGLQVQRYDKMQMPTAAMRGAIVEAMARSQVATHAGGAVGAKGRRRQHAAAVWNGSGGEDMATTREARTARMKLSFVLVQVPQLNQVGCGIILLYVQK